MSTELGSVLLDRFVILSRLGDGGYGQVYRALDRIDNTYVAVKISEGSHEIKQRNVDEARILKYLSSILSPYRQLVINMKTCFVLDNHVILVLELMSQNLYHAIKKNPQNTSYSTIVKYATQMFDFLCFMSQMNIIHADIKPHNILIDENGCFKFADFGLAYCPNLSKKSSYTQSLYYRSPEILLGYDYDASIDVWSTGCVLMQCLLRKALFCVKDEMELMRHIALAVGTPAQHIIRGAPNRSVYFDYNRSLNLWIPKGSILPILPLGLKRYLKKYHNKDIECGKGIALLDLVERMLRPEPFDRITPEECLDHCFLRGVSANRQPEVIFVEKKMRVNASGFSETNANPVEIASSILNQSVGQNSQVIHSKAKENNSPITNVNVAARESKTKLDIKTGKDTTTRNDLTGIPDGQMSEQVRMDAIVNVRNETTFKSAETSKQTSTEKEENMVETETISRKTGKAIKKQRKGECKSNLSIADHIAVYCSKLRLPASVAARTEEIYGRVVEDRVFVRSQPRSVVPACVYVAAREAGIKKTYVDFGKVMGTHESTIRKRVVLLSHRLRLLV